MKYRKRPIVVEAIQYHSSTDALPFHPDAQYRRTTALSMALEVKTVEGWARFVHLDFIVKDVQGFFYPCKPDIFNATHVSEEDPAFYQHPEDTHPAG